MKSALRTAALPGLLFGLACTTYVQIPVVSSMPARFGQTMKGGRRVAVVLLRPKELDMSEFGDYAATLYGAVRNAVEAYRYLVVVDTASRRQRLEEIAFSRTGLTSEQQAMGQELSADAFLFIEVPQAPQHSCTRSSAQTQQSRCKKNNDKGECIETEYYTVTKYTATLNMAVYVQGRLVNVATGQTLAHQATNVGARRALGTDRENSWLFRTLGGNAGELSVTSTGSPPSCPSVLTAFEESARVAAFVLAQNLSPRITDMEVPLEDRMIGVPDKAADRVKAHIKRGIKWADRKPPNLDEAFRSWKAALDLSGGNSVAALWNIAVVLWSRGDYDGSLIHFRKAERIGGPDYLDGSLADTFSRFLKEKERVEKERDRESFFRGWRELFARALGWTL